jgi:guanine deaminase
MEALDKNALESLLQRACAMALANVKSRAGGPFAALLLENGDVVGMGVNHVVTSNDPSAHAEVLAIRDACKRLGRSDLSGLVLLSSCECCPMCLAAAKASNIASVYFAATRKDAARAGFSDDAQYELMLAGGIEKHATRMTIHAAEQLLAGHGAMVEFEHGGKAKYAYGDYRDAGKNDPTDFPCVQAIRSACAEFGHFHLPENTRLISRDMPHPLSLMVADWARIGRVRGGDTQDPAQDKVAKDTSRIHYANTQFESLPQQARAEDVWQEICNPSAVHIALGGGCTAAFDAWCECTASGKLPRY